MIEAARKEQPVFVIQLTRNTERELRYAIIGRVLQRIRDFSAKYDTDGDPDAIERDVELDFAAGTNGYHILVALKDLDVVGHLLSRSVDYFGRRYVYVQQMELDAGSGVTLEQERAAFRVIKQWQRSIGALGIRAVAPSAAHVRRLRMLHGGHGTLTTVKFGDDDE